MILVRDVQANGHVEQVKSRLPSYQRAYRDLLNQERNKKLPDHVIGLNAMVRAIAQELEKTDQVSLNQLRDGVFEGESPGFNSPIGVSVTVRNGDLWYGQLVNSEPGTRKRARLRGELG